MRTFISLIALCFITQAQNRFNSDYFTSKYNLSIPKVTNEMLDVSDLIYKSDSWEYYYQRNTDRLDSIVRMLTIEATPRNLQKDKYKYNDDTVYVNSVSFFIDRDGDTSSVTNYKYTDEFRTQLAYKPKYNCIWKTSFDERGIKLLDVRKCPGEKDFDGQVFHLDTKDDYLEKYRNKNGKIDSNSIRRYYLTPFDSIVADFMVKKGKDPFIVNLNVYNSKRKKQYSYGFGIFSNINEVLSFNYYTYTDKNQLHRSYYFDVIDRKAKEKSYELVNYTEYEYDSLGRKIRVTTRVKPDVKEPDTEDKKK
jgi:hypothetical protein